MGFIFKRGNTAYNLSTFQESETERKNCIFWFTNIKLSFSAIMVTPARKNETH